MENRDQKMFCPACISCGQCFSCFFLTCLYDADWLVEIHAVLQDVSTRLPQNHFWWKFFFFFFFALLTSLGRLTVEHLLPAERVEFPNERIFAHVSLIPLYPP